MMDVKLTGNSLSEQPYPNETRESQARQVFLVVRHRIKPRMLTDYEDFLRRMMHVAAEFQGHLGVQIVPPHGGNLDYTITVRFACQDDAQIWHTSKARRRMLEELQPMLVQDESVDFVSGIDFWFTHSPAVTAPRWKQWLVTTSVIWPLTLTVPSVLIPMFKASPLPLGRVLEHGIAASIMVGLVVFLIMPRYTKLLARWLYKPR